MARSLNGSGDLIDLGNSATLNPVAISISIWVNPVSFTPAYTALVSRIDAGGNNYYQMFIKSTGKLAYYVHGSGGADSLLDPGSHTLSTGTWAPIGLAYDSVNGLATYVNGASDGTAAPHGTVATISAHTEIGNDTNTGGRLLAGSVADCCIWNTNLTAGEFRALSLGVRPYLIRPSAIVGYWPLDGLASPEPDFSGNAFNGILTGTLKANGPPVTLWTRKRPSFASLTKTVFYKTTGTITLPADFNTANNTIECLGESGNASAGGTVSSGAGGGAGAYAKIVNYSAKGQNATVSVTVGTGGAGVQTIFDTANNSCIADFGTSASGTTAGAGGLSTNSTGTTKFPGGNGGAGAAAAAGGSGGGAAGPSGAGGNAAASTNLTSGNGGTADNGKQIGGAGVTVLGVGNPGIAETPAVWVQTSNSEAASPSSGASGAFGISNLTAPEAGGAAVNYGGAPGGGNVSSSAAAGGASAPGIIILTYTPTSPISAIIAGLGALLSHARSFLIGGLASS